MVHKTLLLLGFIIVLVASSNEHITVDHVDDSEFTDFANHPSINQSRLTACDCGWRNSNGALNIVGGTETGVNEYPSMAAIILRNTGTFYCGAHIISTNFVLTAAHCVYGQSSDNLAVLVGDHNITTGNDTPYAALYFVSAYEYHQDYNPSTYENDIALVMTATQIVFSTYVAPICLPFRHYLNSFVDQNVVILGWGQIEFSGPTSDVLLQATLQSLSNSACTSLQDEVISGSEICTYADGKDSCQSDSGGPVLWTDSSVQRMFLIAIISHGVGCATSTPGINTRTTSFLNWILNRTAFSGDVFCYM